MKTTTLFLFVLLAPVMANAQNIGIGTAVPHPSAQLDVSASEKGLLIPRMSTTAIGSIANPAKGLLVYDSVKNQLMVNMGSGISPNWQTIVFKSGWTLTGNSNTNPATDFIGTTDGTPVIIKAFNQKAGRIDVAPFGSTFLGYRAGDLNTGNANTAMGFHALRSNATGTQNIAIGNEALSNNSSGSLNIAHGSQALHYNVSGRQNTAIGSQALVYNTTGNHNTAVGEWALFNNTTGHGNVAIGTRALWASQNKSNLVAIGDSALFNNGQSSPQAWQARSNTAVGSKALFHNSEGSYLTATGERSLYNNTSGLVNSAFGCFSMEGNTTGSYNAALGYRSLEANTQGNANTAMGVYALIANETGSHNTGVGYYALHFNNASQYNTALGAKAADSYYIGWNNTIIGADADVSFNGQYNSIAVGNLATATDNGKVRIGNSSNWSYEAFANWTNISDGRYKKNIQENVAGLSFILKLRPVTYNLDVTALSDKFRENTEGGKNEAQRMAIAEKEQMVWTGFVAQEVEVAANKTGFRFSGVDRPRNQYGVYGLRYAEFVVPLVKAVQEQQEQIEALKKENERLRERLDRIEKLLSNQ